MLNPLTSSESLILHALIGMVRDKVAIQLEIYQYPHFGQGGVMSNLLVKYACQKYYNEIRESGITHKKVAQAKNDAMSLGANANVKKFMEVMIEWIDEETYKIGLELSMQPE